MPKKRYSPEEIIQHLRTVEIEEAKGTTHEEAARNVGVVPQTIVRWKKEYGGLRVDQAKRLKELEQENGRILNTPASTLWFETAQYSLLDSFIRYNCKYRYYLIGQKCVVMVPTLTGIIVPPRNGLFCSFVLTVCAV